jgi:hypothetical protein
MSKFPYFNAPKRREINTAEVPAMEGLISLNLSKVHEAPKNNNSESLSNLLDLKSRDDPLSKNLSKPLHKIFSK